MVRHNGFMMGDGLFTQDGIGLAEHVRAGAGSFHYLSQGVPLPS